MSTSLGRRQAWIPIPLCAKASILAARWILILSCAKTSIVAARWIRLPSCAKTSIASERSETREVRRDADSHIGCELTPSERNAVDEMKAQTRLFTDADLLRTALYRFARHLNLNPPTELFAVRQSRNSRGARKAKAS